LRQTCCPPTPNLPSSQHKHQHLPLLLHPNQPPLLLQRSHQQQQRQQCLQQLLLQLLHQLQQRVCLHGILHPQRQSLRGQLHQQHSSSSSSSSLSAGRQLACLHLQHQLRQCQRQQLLHLNLSMQGGKHLLLPHLHLSR
jgi:hypothetical protein